jgi:hypothetical protein
MDILITDVTEMGGENYCVAGCDTATQRMVRPLPNGRNWPGSLLARHGITVGATIRVVPQGVSTGVFPHRTEDTPITLASIQPIARGFSNWLGKGAPPESESLAVGFNENLQWNNVWKGVRQGAYVLPGTECDSLTAVRVDAADLTFIEDFGKLKGIVSDGSDTYKLAVSSRVLKEAWRKGGLDAVNRALPARPSFHVRVGLARQFGNPPKCYAMLNGVL